MTPQNRSSIVLLPTARAWTGLFHRGIEVRVTADCHDCENRANYFLDENHGSWLELDSSSDASHADSVCFGIDCVPLGMDPVRLRTDPIPLGIDASRFLQDGRVDVFGRG